MISPAYFATMGIPLRGRDFSLHDRESSAYTTIISETMARQYWPNQDPIGRTVILSSFGNRERTIIGVAGDVRHFSSLAGRLRMDDRLDVDREGLGALDPA